MRPQRQKYRGGPDCEQFGDCHRTCIAMILNMDRDDVPHFMADVSPNEPADSAASLGALNAEREWLAKRQLAPVSIPFTGDIQLSDILAMLETQTTAPVILGCTSTNGTNHSVVVHEGQIYNPNFGEVAGPMQDGFWWLTIFSVGPNWVPAPEDAPLRHGERAASVVTQEDN